MYGFFLAQTRTSTLHVDILVELTGAEHEGGPAVGSEVGPGGMIGVENKDTRKRN